MSKAPEVRIAEIQAETALRRDIIELITNPVISIIIGYVAIEGLQRAQIIPEMAGNVAEAGIISAAIAKAGVLTELNKAIGSGTAGLGSLLPLLLAAPK